MILSHEGYKSRKPRALISGWLLKPLINENSTLQICIFLPVIKNSSAVSRRPTFAEIIRHIDSLFMKILSISIPRVGHS